MDSGAAGSSAAGSSRTAEKRKTEKRKRTAAPEPLPPQLKLAKKAESYEVQKRKKREAKSVRRQPLPRASR
jgi:hypothetical protein